MSRNRKADTNESQLWTQTISSLRTLPLPQDTDLPQRFQQTMMEGAKEEGVSKQAREDAYQSLAKDEIQTIKEIEALDKAYETLSVLIALKSASPPASTSTAPTPSSASSHPTPASSSLPHPVQLPSTPSSSQPPPPPPAAPAPAPPSPAIPAPPPPSTIPARLKVNLGSSSPSPNNNNNNNNTPNSALATGSASGSRSGSLPRSSPAPSVSTPGGTTTKERKPKPLTAKEQKWAAQLPLQPGRRVAYYSETEKEWLCFKVVGLGKKERETIYHIRDIDTEAQNSSPIPTTLRYLLPLPDPFAAPSHPSHPSHYPDYPVGSTVFGLFPDTTSFYKAVVEGREKVKGARGARGTEGGGMSSAPYRLRFEDDEGQVRTMEVGDVVEMPGGKV
ncbi:SGF29 tudor-like domain-containing protein [Mrakia frigida]|uniref:SGF29 tudor-like domain-containing protein n=1 Tax=Mrakia frigida TaxID=29902 RepID=UPI003FCBF2B8